MIRNQVIFTLPLPLGRGRVSQSTALRCRSAIRVQANGRGAERGRGEGGVRFTEEQMKWLEMIRDHIAANLSIAPDDFEYAPFSQQGGLGKVHQLFGDKLNTMIEELNETLAA